MGLELFAQRAAAARADHRPGARRRRLGRRTRYLLERHDLEIGAGAGAYAATVWRIGLMGHNASPDRALLVLAALKEILGR